ncbi:MAG: serine protease, partial [Pseudomonadota bacterium]|nr:serine protease [Pseudomonadota bacterium]
MRNLLIILSLTLFTLATPIGISTANAKKEAVVGTDGFADLAERLLPSVVNISSTHKPVEVEDFPDMPHFPPGSPFEDFFEE